jgi:hypothetical protein
MPSIPADFLFVISIIISIISHRVRSANLSTGANTLIAGAAIVLIGALTTWIAFGFTTDVKADILLFCTVIASLSVGLKELFDLLGYQQDAQSPLAPAQSASVEQRPTRATAAYWNRDTQDTSGE